MLTLTIMNLGPYRPQLLISCVFGIGAAELF